MSAIVSALLALIVAATGIARDVDADLMAVAQARAVEISCGDGCFNHDGWRAGTAEVLAWNQSTADPAAAALGQWQGSPPHWSILTDPAYTSIGCGHARVSGRDYFVCLLATIAPGLNSGGEGQAPSGAPSTSATSPPVPDLPDTATAAP